MGGVISLERKDPNRRGISLERNDPFDREILSRESGDSLERIPRRLGRFSRENPSSIDPPPGGGPGPNRGGPDCTPPLRLKRAPHYGRGLRSISDQQMRVISLGILYTSKGYWIPRPPPDRNDPHVGDSLEEIPHRDFSLEEFDVEGL